MSDLEEVDGHSLDNSIWDVVIRGTGLPQSLVALALSRVKKCILHLDRNDYYGGPDTAFSLQEARDWVEHVQTVDRPQPYRDVSVSSDSTSSTSSATADNERTELSFSRAYSLSLSPQIIYARSELLAILVSSKIFRQLEFQALGSWWVYEPSPTSSEAVDRPGHRLGSEGRPGALSRVPSSREDVFADSTLDLKSKRSLMTFLKFVADYEEQRERWEAYAMVPFSEFLSAQFSMASNLHTPLHAISMSSQTPKNTITSFALPRIARHLRSIGLFGPGFGAVIPKWGGAAEISQVACRAGAVGGATYMLGNDVDRVKSDPDEEDESLLRVRLRDGASLRARWLVESLADRLPTENEPPPTADQTAASRLFRSISIVSSPLASLFPALVEGPPRPAGAVVVFPSGSLPGKQTDAEPGDIPPVHIIAHSSETGECPAGQCILYASVLGSNLVDPSLLDAAVHRLLQVVDEDRSSRVLFTLRYTQLGSTLGPVHTEPPDETFPEVGSVLHPSSRILRVPPPSLDLVFDDSTCAHVKSVWAQIVQGVSRDHHTHDDSSPIGNFMDFEDREGVADDDFYGDD